MRFRFALLALAPAAVASPAFATVYMSVEEAQQVMFPGASLVTDERTLTDAQVAAIQRDSGVNVLSKTLHAWRVSTGGWFIVDEVVGKHQFITIALGLDATGAVKDVEILEYKESYGYQVRDAAWRAQFVGAHHGAPLQLGPQIHNISGASLSCRHVTDGVRRLLATYALVLGQ
jgi:hypothetical protein